MNDVVMMWFPWIKSTNGEKSLGSITISNDWQRISVDWKTIITIFVVIVCVCVCAESVWVLQQQKCHSLFSFHQKIAFTFRQIYFESRSHARSPDVHHFGRYNGKAQQCNMSKWNEPFDMKLKSIVSLNCSRLNENYRWKKQPKQHIDAHTLYNPGVEHPNYNSNLLLVSIVHVVIFKRHAENPLFTMCSSTVRIWNGIKVVYMCASGWR